MFYCINSACKRKDCYRHIANINPRYKHYDYRNFEGTTSCPIEKERMRKEYENKGKA